MDGFSTVIMPISKRRLMALFRLEGVFMSEFISENESALDDVTSKGFLKSRRNRPQVRRRKRFKSSSIGRYLFYGLPVVAFVLIISIFVVSIATVKPVEVPFQDFRGNENNRGGQIDRAAPPVLDSSEDSEEFSDADIPTTTPPSEEPAEVPTRWLSRRFCTVRTDRGSRADRSADYNDDNHGNYNDCDNYDN